MASPSLTSELKGRKCRGCDKVFTPASKNVPCPKCATPFHTLCAKQQQKLPNSGFYKCCGTPLNNQNKTPKQITDSASLGNSSLSVDMLRNTICEVIHTTNDELFSRFKTEINTVSDAVLMVQQQLGHVNETIKNHESRLETFETRMQAIESTIRTSPSVGDMEKIQREISDRLYRSKNVIVFNVPEVPPPGDDLISMNQLLSSISTPLIALSAIRLENLAQIPDPDL